MPGSSYPTSRVELMSQRSTCCAVDCDASTVIASREIPLCERHLIQSYREIGEYLRSEQDASEAAGPPLDRRYEPVGLPHGVCPTCRGLCLGVHFDSGDVACLKGCGYSATGSDWQTLVHRYAEECRADTEVVYYLRFGDRVKIGTTTSLTTRLADIPHDEVLATEPGGHRLERQRHAQFKHLRTRVGTHREWFTLTPELLAHIDAVHAREVEPATSA